MSDPLTIRFNAQHRLASCRPVGALSLKHTKQLLDFLLGFEQTHREAFNRLLDLTHVTDVLLRSADIRNYARARLEATGTFRPAALLLSPLRQ
jgi:hypothetical protein